MSTNLRFTGAINQGLDDGDGQQRVILDLGNGLVGLLARQYSLGNKVSMDVVHADAPGELVARTSFDIPVLSNLKEAEGATMVFDETDMIAPWKAAYMGRGVSMVLFGSSSMMGAFLVKVGWQGDQVVVSGAKALQDLGSLSTPLGPSDPNNKWVGQNRIGNPDGLAVTIDDNTTIVRTAPGTYVFLAIGEALSGGNSTGGNGLAYRVFSPGDDNAPPVPTAAWQISQAPVSLSRQYGDTARTVVMNDREILTIFEASGPSGACLGGVKINIVSGEVTWKLWPEVEVASSGSGRTSPLVRIHRDAQIVVYGQDFASSQIVTINPDTMTVQARPMAGDAPDPKLVGSFAGASLGSVYSIYPSAVDAPLSGAPWIMSGMMWSSTTDSQSSPPEGAGVSIGIIGTRGPSGGPGAGRSPRYDFDYLNYSWIGAMTAGLNSALVTATHIVTWRYYDTGKVFAFFRHKDDPVLRAGDRRATGAFISL